MPTVSLNQNFKLSPDLIDYLCTELYSDLEPRMVGGLPVQSKVLSSLKILIDGHYQRGVGQEEELSIAQTTVSKYLEQFIESVNLRLTPKWIVFPGNEIDRNAITSAFETKCRLPDILGAIDCTQIKIFPPPGLEKVQYLNRHNINTLNVQLVADAEARILNVNANYPGRVHDQFIFNYSCVKREMKHLFDTGRENYYLLGDSGYGIEPWLMIPVRGTAPGSPEARYTKWHCRTRNVIERTNGYLKGTFRSLGIDRSLHYSAQKASKIVYTCCTIYNIMKHFRVPMRYESQIIEDANDEEDLPGYNNFNYTQFAIQKRQNIINTYFQR